MFDNIANEQGTAAQPSNDLKRLAKHWPIYPALVIWLLWSFAPGSVTPLQYHLQNSLHASDAQWGQWNAIFAASFIPTFMVFGVLCQRFPLRTLLWWGTVVAVPQLIPLLFISSVTGALIAAVPIGLMGGVATAAYMDLIIRSCPPGLQGTTLMLAATVSVISVRFGDVLGTALYDKYGNFFVCVDCSHCRVRPHPADALAGAQTADINGRRAKTEELIERTEPNGTYRADDMRPTVGLGLILFSTNCWARFNAPKKLQLWYYRKFADTFREMMPGQLSDELRKIVEALET